MPATRPGTPADKQRDPSKWLENQDDWFSDKLKGQSMALNKSKILEVQIESI
jgi:hypothetical protein